MEQTLDTKLESYGENDYYPFHMPGHKRKQIDFPSPYSIDITEIDGFDDLHHATGILKKAQERAAKLYDSNKTYYLVNGSTCGILTAISAAATHGGKVLISRNAHKSVYHALYLKRLSAVYVNPTEMPNHIAGSYRPEDVKELLEKEKEIEAVVITSPTYEGIVSDIAAIAQIAHKHQIPLIVDEAHGAHFGMSEDFPETAVRLGADVVIQSMHKQLPSFTQTALLHLNSDYVSEKEIEKYIDIYETSSPSYILMSGMEKCVSLLEKDKKTLFFQYNRRLKDFYRSVSELKYLTVWKKDDYDSEYAFDVDSSKIVISTAGTNLSGQDLHDILLEKYHLQMEMVCDSYVLAMTSIMDTDEGFHRLVNALYEIDKTLQAKPENDIESLSKLYIPKEKVIEYCLAADEEIETVSFDEAVGRISGTTVSLYPPGIPAILSGERIDKAFIEMLRLAIKLRLNPRGIADIINERIDVIKK